MKTRGKLAKKPHYPNVQNTGFYCITAVFGILIHTTQAAPAQPSAPLIRLSVKPHDAPALQFEAKDAPLKLILKQFAEKTGAVIHYSVLPEENVTATCAGDTVKSVMECLLGNKVDRVYRKLGPQDAAITQTKPAAVSKEEIWILGARYGNTGNMSCTLVARKTGNDDVANDGEDIPQQVLMQMTQMMNNPLYAELGKQALSMLAAGGKTGDTKTDSDITATLENALKGNNPEARAQAVFGLSQQDGGNTEVLHEALQDKNADVRLMAVDSAKADTPQGRAVLSEALNDSDETVSALARQKLDSIGNNPQ